MTVGGGGKGSRAGAAGGRGHRKWLRIVGEGLRRERAEAAAAVVFLQATRVVTGVKVRCSAADRWDRPPSGQSRVASGCGAEFFFSAIISLEVNSKLQNFKICHLTRRIFTFL